MINKIVHIAIIQILILFTSINLFAMGKKWVENEDHILIENYSRIGVDGCLELLKNRTKSSIENRVYHLGLKLDKDFLTTKLSNSKKSINVNPETFKNVTNSYSAYVLGFLWADGWINKSGRNANVSTKISMKDGDEIFKMFSMTGKWHHYNYLSRNETVITTNNTILFNYLNEMDYRTKHKSPKKILNTIPDNLIRYFYLGVIDGDGCFYFNDKINQKQFAVTSCENQNWSYFVELAKKLNIDYQIRRVNSTNSYSQFRIFKSKDIMVLGDYLYGGDIKGLKRKYNKFKQIKKYYE